MKHYAWNDAWDVKDGEPVNISLVEIAEAVRNGHPTARQRREWSPTHWELYYNGRTARDEKATLEYLTGNSPERLRELVGELTWRVEKLETLLSNIMQAHK
jgi:hypothetical protein